MERKRVGALMKERFQEDFKWENVDLREYEETLSQSRFVICPAGAGFDTSCVWGSQVVGTIPIVESGSGMERLLGTLPVLLVQDFDEVTPELLKSIYPYFLLHAKDWRWDSHTKSAWFSEFNNLDVNKASEKYPFVRSSKKFVLPPECAGKWTKDFTIEEDNYHQVCRPLSTMRTRASASSNDFDIGFR